MKAQVGRNFPRSDREYQRVRIPLTSATMLEVDSEGRLWLDYIPVGIANPGFVEAALVDSWPFEIDSTWEGRHIPKHHV